MKNDTHVFDSSSLQLEVSGCLSRHLVGKGTQRVKKNASVLVGCDYWSIFCIVIRSMYTWYSYDFSR